jgi:uncharacterized glyoxalase superfamily protein PhnB
MSDQYKPAGFHTVTPYLVVTDVPRLIEFLKQAFDAESLGEPHAGPEGKIMHAEMKIGDSPIMMGEANEMYPPTRPSLYMYVPDVDAVYQKALADGATSLREPADQFYGDRNCGLLDPCGNNWWIATHKGSPKQ